MVIHDVVVNHHVVGASVSGVLVACAFNVVFFGAVGDVDELEPVASADPDHVLANVGNQTGDVVVASVEDTVCLGEGDEPLVGRNVVAKHAQSVRADVGDVAHDLNNGVACLGALPPVVVVLEVGLGDEPDARGRPPVDVIAVHTNADGGPVGHAVVDVLTVVDAHRAEVVLADTDVGSRIQIPTSARTVDNEVVELLGSGLPRVTLAETGRLISIPLPRTLLGSDVEV